MTAQAVTEAEESQERRDPQPRESPRFSVGAALEVPMANLYETNDPKRKEQIDTAGWVFLVLAITIIVIAAMVAYNGNNAVVANTTVSHVSAPHG